MTRVIGDSTGGHRQTGSTFAKTAIDVDMPARHGIILGFPSGEGDRASDLYYEELLRSKGKHRPDWLEEHLENGPVDPVQIETTLNGIHGIRYGFVENQSVRLGLLLSRIESIRIIKAMASVLCHLTPAMIGALFGKYLDRHPPYARRIYTIHLK